MVTGSKPEVLLSFWGRHQASIGRDIPRPRRPEGPIIGIFADIGKTIDIIEKWFYLFKRTTILFELLDFGIEIGIDPILLTFRRSEFRLCHILNAWVWYAD